MDRWSIDPIDQRHLVPGKILTRGKVPRRFWDANLQFMPDSPSKQKYVEYLKALDDKLKGGTGLMLHGPFGTGKSACASLVLIEVLARSSNRVMFVQSAQLDWMARHRDDTDENGVPDWDVVTQGPFVVVDDVGAERQVDWNNAWFEEVVRARYNDKLPTILTTNRPLPDLFKKFEWLEGILRDSSDSIEMTERFR
jgi:DNA replication protein DnaC